MKTRVEGCYAVSARVVLRPGDRFRVSAGPYWRLPSGEKLPMAVRGVCEFLEARVAGRRVLVVAWTRNGIAVLHVAGRRRNPLMPELVCRPYKIKGKVRK
jgi:hypothetical protein